MTYNSIHLIKQSKRGYNLSFHVTSWFQTPWNFSNHPCGWKLMWGTWKKHPQHYLGIYIWNGQYASKGVLLKFKLELALVDLILTPSLPLDMSCLSSNPLLNWWQTPGVLQPSPLKGIASRDSMRKTFKGRETCHSVSNISDSIRLLNFEVSERLV